MRLGDHDYKQEGDTEFSVDHYVMDQWQHPQYNEDTTDMDIGLLHLADRIQFSKYKGTIGKGLKRNVLKLVFYC